MWRRDPVTHLMQGSIGRVRTEVGTLTQGSFRTEGLVIAEMITKQEYLSRVGVRQDGKRSGRRDRLGRSEASPADSTVLISPSEPSLFIANSITVVPRFQFADFFSS